MSFTQSTCHNGKSLVNGNLSHFEKSAKDLISNETYNLAIMAANSPYLNLAKWRIKNRFTQEQLGNMLGVSNTAISRWESGHRQLDVEDLIKIAAVFNIEPVALFLAPEDYEKAVAIDRFAKLIGEIGVERATSLLAAFSTPQK